MKKIFLGIISIITIILSISFTNSTAYAACMPTFLVGSETVSGCSGVTNDQKIEGFSIDIDNNKITLNNYHGGGIYFFCHGSCPSTFKSMEIELIGENTIDSKLSASAPQEIYIPQKIDAGFINIFPTFTGTGSLHIKATAPFAFENEGFIYGLKITNDESQASQISFSTPDNTTDTLAEDEEEEMEKEEIEPEEETKTTGKDNLNKNTSFFETITGIILLITVPSILLIIILILTILLIREKKQKNTTNNNINTSNTINTNQ